MCMYISYLSWRVSECVDGVKLRDIFGHISTIIPATRWHGREHNINLFMYAGIIVKPWSLVPERSPPTPINEVLNGCSKEMAALHSDYQTQIMRMKQIECCCWKCMYLSAASFICIDQGWALNVEMIFLCCCIKWCSSKLLDQVGSRGCDAMLAAWLSAPERLKEMKN